jgi:hypothetical protein
MYKRFLFVVVSFVFLLLTACGGETAAPVVRAQPNAEGGISTFQVEMHTEFKNSDGLSGQGPRGILASYLFKDDGHSLTLRLSSKHVWRRSGSGSHL